MFLASTAGSYYKSQAAMDFYTNWGILFEEIASSVGNLYDASFYIDRLDSMPTDEQTNQKIKEEYRTMAGVDIGDGFGLFKDYSKKEVIPVDTALSGYAVDEALTRAEFSSYVKGTPCTGVFCASALDLGTTMQDGVDIGLMSVGMFTGAIAPNDACIEAIPRLMECIYSLNFSQEYINQGRMQGEAIVSAAMDYSAQMNATYSSYNSAWRSRQTSYDVISQKNSDATLGYDRLYDTNTGEIYRAELGFYDSYDANRNSYTNPNLQRIDSSNDNYYLNGVDYYIYK